MDKKVLGLLTVVLLLGGLALLGGGAYFYLSVYKPFDTYKKAVTEFSELDFAKKIEDFTVDVEIEGTTKTTFYGETSTDKLDSSYEMEVNVEDKKYNVDTETTEWDEPILVALAKTLKGKMLPWGIKGLKAEKSTKDEWVYSYTLTEGSKELEDLFSDYEKNFIEGFVGSVETDEGLETEFKFNGDLVITSYVDKKTGLLNKVEFKLPTKIEVNITLIYMDEEYEVSAVIEDQAVIYEVNYKN